MCISRNFAYLLPKINLEKNACSVAKRYIHQDVITVNIEPEIAIAFISVRCMFSANSTNRFWISNVNIIHGISASRIRNHDELNIYLNIARRRRLTRTQPKKSGRKCVSVAPRIK